MAVKMKDTVLVQCSRCGITERHKYPEYFVDKGWIVRGRVPFCPCCKQMIDEYKEFSDYLDYLKCCESERLATLRTERK